MPPLLSGIAYELSVVSSAHLPSLRPSPCERNFLKGEPFFSQGKRKRFSRISKEIRGKFLPYDLACEPSSDFLFKWRTGVNYMRLRFLGSLGLILAAMVAPVEAGVLFLDYTTADIGGGLFKYDFKLSVNNQDNTYFNGQNFNWIIFGDTVGPSPISDFSLDSETFSNPNILFTSTTGGHNGPTFLDTKNLIIGWVPTGVGDFVTWSGTSANNVTSGLLFSNLIGNGNVSEFVPAQYNSSVAVPEPTSFAVLGLGALGMAFARRKRKEKTLTI